MTMIASEKAAAELATIAIDDFLRLVAAVRTERHRDPMRALQDRLLDMRAEVGRG